MVLHLRPCLKVPFRCLMHLDIRIFYLPGCCYWKTPFIYIGMSWSPNFHGPGYGPVLRSFPKFWGNGLRGNLVPWDPKGNYFLEGAHNAALNFWSPVLFASPHTPRQSKIVSKCPLSKRHDSASIESQRNEFLCRYGRGSQ